MTLRTLSDAASRPALGDLWPIAAVFGDGGCVKHPPVPFLPYPEPCEHSLRPRKVGITLRTLSARPVRSAAVRAARLDWKCPEQRKVSRGANAPRELSAAGHRRHRRVARIPSAQHGRAAGGPV